MIFNYYINSESTIIDYLNKFYISKSKIYKFFNDDCILLNNHKCKKEDKIKSGDIITIIQNEEIDYKPIDKKLDILYEDDYLLIINKQSGIPIHEGKDNNNSLANIVAGYYKEKGIDLNIRFAHRLDIDTTGIIIFAKDLLTFSYLNHIIETHELKRYYRLIVNGKLRPKKGIINQPISNNRHNNNMIINKNGMEAITNYNVLKEYPNYSYVECLLDTGRKHQIRCHMSYLGNPIIGDKDYNDKSNLSNRCLLHSYRVVFIHPVYLEEIDLICDIPSDFKKLL